MLLAIYQAGKRPLEKVLRLVAVAQEDGEKVPGHVEVQLSSTSIVEAIRADDLVKWVGHKE